LNAFELADFVRVDNADLADGLLTVDSARSARSDEAEKSADRRAKAAVVIDGGSSEAA